MKLNKDKNEILALVINGNEYYFSNSSKLSKALNIPVSVVNYYVLEKKVLKKFASEMFIKIVDGTDIPFGQINKYKL